VALVLINIRLHLHRKMTACRQTASTIKNEVKVKLAS